MEPDRKYLTREEVERLLVCDIPKVDKLLIQLGLTLGCRVSEIVSIRVRRIRGRTIKIHDEKKDEDRVCVIDSGTEEILNNYLETEYKVPKGYRRDLQLLFYFSAKTANRKIKKAFEKAAISPPDVVPWRCHTLRHTYVRHTLDRLKDRGIQFVCEQTGDSPQTILGYYGIPSLDERIRVAEEYPLTR